MTYGKYPDIFCVKKILVVKLRHLGDVLLTSPVFTELQRVLPNAQIDAYIYEEAKPILHGHPAICELIGYDRKWKKLGLIRRLAKEWSLWRCIRKKQYDMVINLTEGDRGALAAKIAKAKIRVGFTPKGKWQKKLYTHTVKNFGGVRHAVERNLDALRCIGIFPKEEHRELVFHIDEKISLEAPFILIHPSSRWRFKCWSTAHMRSLIEELLKQGKRVVLTSGPDPVEVGMVEEIAQGLDVENLAGKTSIKQLGALIDKSECLVCVDSVAHHMANALKKRVVVLFGPTSEITWGPWRNPHARVVTKQLPCRPCHQDGCAGSKYSDCLQTLPVKQVLDAINLKDREINRMVRIGDKKYPDHLVHSCYTRFTLKFPQGMPSNGSL